MIHLSDYSSDEGNLRITNNPLSSKAQMQYYLRRLSSKKTRCCHPHPSRINIREPEKFQFNYNKLFDYRFVSCFFSTVFLYLKCLMSKYRNTLSNLFGGCQITHPLPLTLIEAEKDTAKVCGITPVTESIALKVLKFSVH